MNPLFLKLKSEIKKREKLAAILKKAKSAIERGVWFIPLLHKTYTTNTKNIGLDLTSICNLSCPGCEASCPQAMSNEYMLLEQIEKFVNESIQSGWEWEGIKLRGGEPTLHPQFFDALKIIKRYKDQYPACIVTLQTNGCGNRVREILSKVPDWVSVASLPREGLVFSSYNVAPRDLLNYRFYRSFAKGCWRTQKCNMALSRYGYYPCSPGMNVDRVFGFNIGIKKLSLLNETAFKGQLDTLCGYCGHFKEPNENVDKEKVTISWKQAYEKYKETKPVISLY